MIARFVRGGAWARSQVCRGLLGLGLAGWLLLGVGCRDPEATPIRTQTKARMMATLQEVEAKLPPERWRRVAGAFIFFGDTNFDAFPRSSWSASSLDDNRLTDGARLGLDGFTVGALIVRAQGLWLQRRQNVLAEIARVQATYDDLMQAETNLAEGLARMQQFANVVGPVRWFDSGAIRSPEIDLELKNHHDRPLRSIIVLVQLRLTRTGTVISAEEYSERFQPVLLPGEAALRPHRMPVLSMAAAPVDRGEVIAEVKVTQIYDADNNLLVEPLAPSHDERKAIAQRELALWQGRLAYLDNRAQFGFLD